MNSFPSAASRTRVVAGREIIRDINSGNTRVLISSDIVTQVATSRAYKW